MLAYPVAEAVAVGESWIDACPGLPEAPPGMNLVQALSHTCTMTIYRLPLYEVRSRLIEAYLSWHYEVICRKSEWLRLFFEKSDTDLAG